MTPWDRSQLALALLAHAPDGLGGIVVRGRAGPARDAFVAAAQRLIMDMGKIHPAMTNDALDGSIDLTATLDAGRIVQHAGLLARDCHFLLAMAERTPPYLAARLSMALDANTLRGLIALDEGIDDDALPVTLSDRMAFFVTLDDIAVADINATMSFRSNKSPIKTPIDLPNQLIILAERLGITSLRAPVFALRTAIAHANLMGRDAIADDDITAAVALVYAHRTTQLPQDAPDQPTTNDAADPPTPSDPSKSPDIPDDMLLDAVLSALPKGLLDQLSAGTTKGGKGAGTGRKIIGNRRGRPLPARDGTARSNSRIDLMATLRAALPWQTIRRKAQPGRKSPMIRPSDLRAKRYQDLSDRLLVFAVDASGSAAFARLNEAKGAIEILLGEAYARRDHVALIAFRGTTAEVLLPPTRSLVQTKRRLASLPGGGGTPLAAGINAAIDLAEQARKRGQTPTVVTLTDGRSNVALDGTANRTAAAADAVTAARRLAASKLDAIMIDTGQRPEQALHHLAKTMGAHYIPLPRADAKSLSDIVTTTLQTK